MQDDVTYKDILITVDYSDYGDELAIDNVFIGSICIDSILSDDQDIEILAILEENHRADAEADDYDLYLINKDDNND